MWQAAKQCGTYMARGKGVEESIMAELDPKRLPIIVQSAAHGVVLGLLTEITPQKDNAQDVLLVAFGLLGYGYL